jgi:cadmium resistance protein CadD (predicted permease)
VGFIDVFITAAGAFVGTNIDDFILLLLLILGMPAGGHHRWQIVAGQYAGFCVLVMASLLGAVALHSVPENWVGLLGFIPLGLGIRGVVRIRRGQAGSQEKPILAGNLATVTMVTIANGGDNIAVYVLIFRELNAAGIAVSIFAFLILLGALCAIALIIGERAKRLLGAARGAQWITSIVFIIIGIALLIRTGAIANLVSYAS